MTEQEDQEAPDQEISDDSLSDLRRMFGDAQKNIIKNKRQKTINSIVPGDFATVHTDKIMVGIDNTTDTVTLTLLQMHPFPQIDPDSGSWGLEAFKWTIVGEIKLPTNVMNDLVIYYVLQMANGLDIVPIVEDWVRKHPFAANKSKQITYGGRSQISVNP